jgi:chromosome segregation ATPase
MRMSELRRDREWEHWPQDRRPEDGIRRKLRELFHPTLGDDEIEQALTAHTRELELRATQLAETVADLERREERTRELRATVEQMLRRGSAELDERHAELTDLAERLAERESTAAEAEEALAERRRELGAVELRRAAVERREETLAERETDVASRLEELEERERQLARLDEEARELDARELALDRRAAEVESLQARIAETLAVVEREQQALSAREHVLEAREQALVERERHVTNLEQREEALHSSAAELEAREASLASDLAAMADRKEELRQAVASVSQSLGIAATVQDAPGTSATYVAMVAGETGYRLVERGDGPPVAGARILVDDEPFTIVRVRSSPLPGDTRRCAVAERAPEP